ncbi:hypothetical protein NQT62_03280 [Limnobacter humi]|uniref:Uncharacterized protein n=1 Tax=Limnobacter humi TaxID=1778671 RepID=A0ABT1WEJ3_9BURK|nr:hypothetical protein [Limnobacter humi]MCQ8895461.1 hypothetical protein [Limnobacter humi]
MIQAWVLAPLEVGSQRQADWTLSLRPPTEKVWLAEHLQAWCLPANKIDPHSLALPWSAAQDAVVLWLNDDTVSAKNRLRRLNRAKSANGNTVWSPWYVPDYLALCLQSPQSSAWWLGVEAISLCRQHVWETQYRPADWATPIDRVQPMEHSRLTVCQGSLIEDSLHALSARLHAKALSSVMAAAGVPIPEDAGLLGTHWLGLALDHPSATAHDVAASLLCSIYFQGLMRCETALRLWNPLLVHQALTTPPGDAARATKTEALLNGLHAVHQQFAGMGMALDVLGTGGRSVNWAEWLLNADDQSGSPIGPMTLGFAGSDQWPRADLSTLPSIPADALWVLKQAASPRYLPGSPELAQWSVCVPSDSQAQYPLKTLRVRDDRVLHVQFDWQGGAPVLSCGPADKAERIQLNRIAEYPLDTALWFDSWLVPLPAANTERDQGLILGAMLHARAELQGWWMQTPGSHGMVWQWHVEHQLHAEPTLSDNGHEWVTLHGMVGPQSVELRVRIQPPVAAHESGSTLCSTEHLLTGQPFWSQTLTWPLLIALVSVRKPGWPEWQLSEIQSGCVALRVRLWRDLADHLQASASLDYQPPVVQMTGWCAWQGILSRRIVLGQEQTLQQWESPHG